MSIWKSIAKYFTEEPEKKEEATKKPANPETSQTVFKALFTKNDPHTLTTFPYNLSEEFFAPLDADERKYIVNEIIRWHSIYIDVALEHIIELVSYYIKKKNENNPIASFMDKYREEYEFIAMEIVHSKYLEFASKRTFHLHDRELLEWKPVKGYYSFEPSDTEISEILVQIGDVIEVEIKSEIIKIQEAELVVTKLQNEVPVSDKAMFAQAHLLEVLDANKAVIAKHCYDRLMLEYIFFPQYEGKLEKEFNNKLFHKYRENFGIDNFNQMMSKVYKDINEYLKYKNKEDLKVWIIYEWKEFVKFATNEFANLEDEELANINAENFNIYKLSLDYFCIVLFKIYLDGMK